MMLSAPCPGFGIIWAEAGVRTDGKPKASCESRGSRQNTQHHGGIRHEEDGSRLQMGALLQSVEVRRTLSVADGATEPRDIPQASTPHARGQACNLC